VVSTAETATDLGPSDFLDVGALLSDEELLIRNTVRTFVARRVLSRIDRWFEDGVFPIEMARELGTLGLLGMHLQGYGCAGASAVSYGLACMELEAGDSGFRSFVSVQGSLAMFPIWKYGSEEQKVEWRPRLASGEAIGCFGLTEPDFGSDPAGMRTTARRSRQGLGLERPKDVDYERGNRRRGNCVGEDRPRHPRFLVPRRFQGVHQQGYRAQDLVAGVHHIGAYSRGLRAARHRSITECNRPKGPVVVPQ
jgi:hypothetical protein